MLKAISRIMFNRFKVLKIACICERIEIDYTNVFIGPQYIQNEIGSNKTSSTGHQICFHEISSRLRALACVSSFVLV